MELQKDLQRRSDMIELPKITKNNATELLKLAEESPVLFAQSYGISNEQYEKFKKELQLFLKRSARSKNNKAKGSAYERKIAKIFSDEYGITLKRTPKSGGFSKANAQFCGDITAIDANFVLHIECKNQKVITIEKWITQSEEDCQKGKIPVVVYKRMRGNKVGDYINMRLEDFLSVVDKNKVVLK